jgi:hypothetical protein
MRTTFAIVSTLFAAFLLASGCGSSSSHCGPDNCSSCCDEQRQCVVLVSAATCGKDGFSCETCNADQSCYTGRCGPANPHYAFETSTTYDGNLATAGSAPNGLLGGDMLCQSVATAAGLSGTFKAWLSNSTTNAIDRLIDVGGWYTPGAFPYAIFANKAQLATGPSSSFTDEHGNGASGEPWTGTKAGGAKATSDAFVGTSANCNGWSVAYMDSGVTGLNGMTTGDWTEHAAYQCQNKRPIYCFQQ